MSIFFYYKSDGRFWFRLFGVGLSFVRKDKWLFSMRYGIDCFRAFGWGAEFLRNDLPKQVKA